MTEKILLDITLEGLPPTVNHSYGYVGRRTYKTEECREYQLLTTLKLKAAYQGDTPYTDAVALSITFYSADRRRWDIDNRVKALQDCLNMAGVIKDDRQIEMLVVSREHGKKNSTRIRLYRKEKKNEAER